MLHEERLGGKFGWFIVCERVPVYICVPQAFTIATLYDRRIKYELLSHKKWYFFGMTCLKAKLVDRNEYV